MEQNENITMTGMSPNKLWTLRLYKMLDMRFYCDARKLEEELRTENSWLPKQSFFDQLQQLLAKLASNHAELIQTVNSNVATDRLTDLSKEENNHRDLPKQNKQTTDSGNQRELVLSTSEGDTDLNET